MNSVNYHSTQGVKGNELDGLFDEYLPTRPKRKTKGFKGRWSGRDALYRPLRVVHQ